LITHQRQLVKMLTMTHNRLHSVVHRNNLVPPEGGFFVDKNRSWWESLTLPPVEKLQVCQDLAMLDHLEPQIAEVGQELARQWPDPLHRTYHQTWVQGTALPALAG
jgi:hypothetical protein